MHIAYFDCFSGASGDMILGAMLDVGLSLTALRQELSRLPLSGWGIEAEAVTRAGIGATKAHVRQSAEAQPHRRLGDILAILRSSALPTADVERAGAIFRALAEAEARVHRTTVDDIHFHEVGAIDAIIDITAAVVGLRLLGVEQVYVSALPVGDGSVRAEHGVLPVPAPATLELLTAAGAPLRPAFGEPRMELVTPTGAAILTTLGRFERPAMRLRAAGAGAGGRDVPGRPNILRVWLADTEDRPGMRTMCLLETNIDDMSGEMFGYAMEQLFAAGAADVWCTAVQMKKDRPAITLSVLCRPELEPMLVQAILRHTSTLGVRSRDVRRYEAERERFDFPSSLGPASVKVKRLEGAPAAFAPEYEVCRNLAKDNGLPLLEVYRIVTDEAIRAYTGKE